MSVDEALAQLQHDYYASVRALAETLLHRLKNGEFADASQARGAIRTSASGSTWAQTTGAAYQALLCSDNEVNAWEDLNLQSAPGDLILLAANATYRLDVLDEIEGTLAMELDVDSLEELFAYSDNEDTPAAQGELFHD